MKRIVTSLILIAVTAMLFTMVSCTEHNLMEELRFVLNEDGQSYGVEFNYNVFTQDVTEIVIPNTYNGLPVTVIRQNAFGNVKSIVSVEIPDSIISIESGAFYGCNALVNIFIPYSVTDIAYSAFEYCESLEWIEVDSNNKNYTSISGNLYNKDATILLRYAMGKNDISFTVPETVETIESWAFSFCKSLSRIVIPASVNNIYSDFTWCTGLENIVVNENNEYYSSLDGNLYNKDQTKLLRYAIGKKDTTFTIPDSVESIGFFALNQASNLKTIVIGESITRITIDMFNTLDSLEKVVIPNTVTGIEERSFYACPNLTSIVIPSSVEFIGGSMVVECPKVTIYCESDSWPVGWDDNWNKGYDGKFVPVVWGYDVE